MNPRNPAFNYRECELINSSLTSWAVFTGNYDYIWNVAAEILIKYTNPYGDLNTLIPNWISKFTFIFREMTGQDGNLHTIPHTISLNGEEVYIKKRAMGYLWNVKFCSLR